MTTITDSEILDGISNGKLVFEGNKENIGPACYELSMGSIYYDLTEGDRRIDASSEGTILIKPGHRVVLITHEAIEVPEDMVGRIISKGSLFSVGLSPASTCADPGFPGNIGIVTQNFSDKYIEIPIGEPIAKIDFSYLTKAVKNPYKGQHGFQTNIWPIKHHLQKEFHEVQNDPRVGTEIEEAFKILPAATAKAISNLQKKQKIIDWAIFVFLFLNILILFALSSNYIDEIIAFTINFITSVLIAVFMFVIKREVNCGH